MRSGVSACAYGPSARNQSQARSHQWVAILEPGALPVSH